MKSPNSMLFVTISTFVCLPHAKGTVGFRWVSNPAGILYHIHDHHIHVSVISL